MPLLQVIVSQKAASRCVFAEADAEEGVLEGLNLWAPVEGWQWKVSAVSQKNSDVRILLPQGFATGRCVKEWSGSELALAR